MGERRLNVLTLVGGASPEHSISLRPGATVLRAIETGGHRATVVGITREGLWLGGDFKPLLARAETELLELGTGDGAPVALVRDLEGARLLDLSSAAQARNNGKIDVAFPVLHGPGGEDGCIQGLLELAGLPYVGANTAASAIAMDKLAMKTLCAGAGIPQVEFINASAKSHDEVRTEVEAGFAYPCFVKPANLGSSVGISRACNAAELAAGLDEARRYDSRVVVERAVDAREIEIAILGDEFSPPGEILAEQGFYDFDTKYVSSQDAGLLAPCELDSDSLRQVKEIATRAWSLIGGEAMARADFFIEHSSGTVYLNEINTIPGFTEISMYPRLWHAAGLSTAELVDRLLELALSRG